MMYYLYGMKSRGFSVGCQPMDGLVSWKDTDGKYYSELEYDRKLRDDEIEDYELEFIREVSEAPEKHITQEYIQQILEDYGVAFTQALSEKLYEEFKKELEEGHV